MNEIIEKAKKLVYTDEDDLIYIIELLIDEVEHLQEENKDLEHKLSNSEDYEPVKEWWEQ